MAIMMRADVVWCPWAAWFGGSQKNPSSRVNCSTKERRIRCCYSLALTGNEVVPNCSGQTQSRSRSLICKDSSFYNKTLSGASHESDPIDLNWYLVIIVFSILVFTCCIIFRIWHLFHRCLQSEDLGQTEHSRPLDYNARPSSARSSTHTIDVRDYADEIELRDLCDQRAMSLDGDGSLTPTHRLVVPSAPSAPEEQSTDAPPTYDDIAVSEGPSGAPRLAARQDAPAVVNFSGHTFNDAPPAYEETVTPPPRYEDI